MARASVRGRRRRQPRPGRPPGQALGVEPGRLIALEPRRQDLRLPGPGRRLEAFEHREDRGQRVRPLEPRRRPSTCCQANRKRRKSRAATGSISARRRLIGVAVDAREQPPVAPLLVVDAGQEAAAQDRAVGFQRDQRGARRPRLESERRRKRCRRDRAEPLEPAAQDLDQRLLARPRLSRPRRPAARSPARAAPRARARGTGSAARPESRASRAALASARRACRRASASSQSLQSGAACASASVRQPSHSSASCSSSALIGSGQASARTAGDRLGIEPAEVGGALRIAPAPRHHRLRPPLLERRVVEKGVGLGGQHLERERRGLGQVAGRRRGSRPLRCARAAARGPRCPSPRAGSR